ncbi:TonB-dependent receptor [Edaphobacter modestus]|uniref:Carboxypeptidase family protein n=1 Tax=Edaphobacter modestus TaxID=388466 RepID=A0A4Q7YT34_9BACT|nr:carboxypeptidase regulatory-like domain-containing protein [Edaphobacter modestus]RZU40738.1 carboxypeptidase family protein [Edaphobacter modestus]
MRKFIKNRIAFSRLLRLFLCVSLASGVAVAQGGNQGALQGIVTDPSGAVVSDATITIVNPTRGTSYTGTTNKSGTFTFPVVPTGFYDVMIEHAGFSKVEQKHVEVTVGGKVELPVMLQVGANQTVVEVIGVPVVDTVRTNVAESVNERQVANLPVLGRNFLDFTLLTPGVSRDVRGGDLSFGGQRGTLNSLTIDGADNNNTFFGQTLGRTGSGRAPYQFSQDAVQEFQVNTSTFAPEFGRAGGAVVNVVTKSGTNQFHGTVFEFFRDRGLNANDQVYSQQLSYFKQGLRATAPTKPGYHFHQFGGNLGGPVLKGKLFFFFDYDGQRNSVGIPVALSIPSLGRPATAAETAAINYLTARSGTYLTTFNQDVYLGKLDYRINAANVISGRYNGQRFKGTNLENSGTASAAEHTGNSNVNTDTFALELNTTLSQKLVNQLRGSYQRDNEPGLSNSQNPEAAVRQNGTTLLTVGRNNFSPRETTLHRQQYADAVTYVAGTHTIKVGVDWLRDQILNYFPGNFSGAYTFDSLENFGRSLTGQALQATATGSSALQLVQAYAGTGTSGPTTNPDNAQLAAFAQDDWRATRRLQVTYGVRWDRQTYHQPGIVNAQALATGFDTSRVPVDDMNFGPRLGVAYQPFANSDRTVIRAGGGIFYGNTPSILTGTASSNNGVNLQTFTFQPTTGPAPTNANATGQPYFPGQIAYPNNTCGVPTDAPRCTPPAGFAAAKSNLFLFDSKYHQPRIVQYNAQIQQQVAKDTSVTIGYLGVRGTRLTRTRNANFVSETPATILNTAGQSFSYMRINSSQLVNPNFNQIFQFEATAHSAYNGLTAQLDKRFAQGLQLSAAYTWSKVIDDAPDATAVVVGSDDGKEAYDPLNPRLDLAPGNNDVRNRFVLSTVWDLDYFTKNLHGVLRPVAGGWSVSGIITAQSGQPYTALINTALNGSLLIANQRTPGSARNQYRLPNYISVDPRITKTIGREKFKVLLIGEAFNVMNRTNITAYNNQQYVVTNNVLVPNTSPTTGFQTPRAFGNNPSYNGRVLQLAAKIQF